MNRLLWHGQKMNIANPAYIPSLPNGPLAKRVNSSASQRQNIAQQSSYEYIENEIKYSRSF